MIAYFKQKDNNFYSNNKQNRTITNIIALDGEGWNNSEGIHHYYILSAVDLNYNKKTLYTEKPLTTDECLNFLLSLSGNKGDLFISFAFTSYDVTKILEDLTQDQLKLLRSNKEVIYKDYKIKHLKNKYFSIIDLNSKTSFIKYNGEKVEYYKNKITIYDVFSYYSCSFVKVCHQYKHLFKDKNIEIPKITDKDDIELTEVAENIDNEEELIDFITAMKATRSEFKEENLKQIIEYCELENYILATIYKHTLNMCSSIDITPSYHSGPGALAENYLETQNISKYIRLKDSKINNIAKNSYYGGRFETSIIGYAGDGYTYDINSAYPNIIINLPCLSCSSWIHTTNYLSDYTYGFYKVSVSSNLKSIWSPFPFKVTQSNRYDIDDLNLNVNQIFYPIGGTRWVTAEELRIAYKYFNSEEIKVLDGYILDVKCDHIPFNDVITLYERRKEYKKIGNDSQIVIKLIINSLYGKLAQVVGKSKFTSWSWAAWITGHTRSMLADIALKYQNNILMLATDGIVSKYKLPELKVSDSLGDWEFDEVKDIYIFKPGLYVYTDKSGKQVAKRRGYQSSQLSAAYLLDKWSSGELIFPTENPQDKFYTYSEAVQRIDFKDKLGQWTKEYKDINLNDTRRNVANKDNNVITTIPWRINEGVGQYDDLGTKRINYDIKGKDNKLIGREVRLEYQTSDGIKKRIWQESLVNDVWVRNASSLKNMLYKLPEVMKVIERQNKNNACQIYIVEGCKNAYVLNKYLDTNNIKAIATTKLAGALNNIEAYEWLKDAKDICFILDNDEAGFKHGKLAYEYLRNINKEINIEFKKSKTEGSGDDVVDHLEKGYKLDELADVDINEILKIEDKKYTNNNSLEENTEEITDKGIIFLNKWLEVNKEILKDVIKRSDKQYISLCPNHDDNIQSFMIGVNNICNLCVFIYCHTCGKDKFSQIVKYFVNGVSNKDCERHTDKLFNIFNDINNEGVNTMLNGNTNSREDSKFPMEIFNGLVGRGITALKKVTQVAKENIGALIFPALGVALAGKYDVNVWDSWSESAAFYVICIMPPGHRKSALIQLLVKPFLDVEDKLAREAKDPILQAINLKKLALSKAEKARKSAINTDNREEFDKYQDELNHWTSIERDIEIPKERRFLAQDGTIESLTSILSNHESLGILDPEGGAVIDIMGGKYNGGKPQLDLFLRGYSGDSIIIDRVGRSRERIRKPVINIGICTQEVMLQKLANIPEFFERSLIGRLLLCNVDTNLGDREVHPNITEEDRNDIAKLQLLFYNIACESDKIIDTRTVNYDDEAMVVMEQFSQEIEDRMHPSGDLSYIAEQASKLAGHAARIALGIHAFKNVTDECTLKEGWYKMAIDKESAEQGIKVARWFFGQAIEAANTTLKKSEDRDEDDFNEDKAKKLMIYIKKKGFKEFTASELQQKVRKVKSIGLATTEEVENILYVLASKKILKFIIKDDTGGRPTTIFTIN